MKSKLSWVPFILLTPVAVFCKLAQNLFEEGTVLGLSNLMLDYAFLAAVVLIFLFALLFCLIDTRISPYYVPHRNFAAGVIGIILAVALAGDGANMIFQMVGAGSVEALRMILAVLLVLSAIVFIVLGLNHSFNSEDNRRFALFNVLPALYCAVRMITCFVQFTTISIRLADVACLACYIFATMFFFNYAVALSLTKAKNAVKSCFIFGFPAVAALVAYSAAKLIFSFDGEVLLNNLETFEMALMALYIFSFLIELTAFVPTRDSVRVIDGDDQEDIGENDPESDGFLVNTGNAERDSEPASAYLMTADTEGYLFRKEDVNDNDDSYYATLDDVDSYLTDSAPAKTDAEDKPKDYASRLDEIDKLILEISGNSD